MPKFQNTLMNNVNDLRAIWPETEGEMYHFLSFLSTI